MCHITYRSTKLHKLGTENFLNLWGKQEYLKDLTVIEEREMGATKWHVFNYHDFSHFRRNREKVFCLHRGCLSICQHISQRLALDGFSSNLIVGGFMVICRLPPVLVEIGQICQLLPQRQLSHMLAARIWWLVLCFTLSNIAFIWVFMILKDVCLLPA